MEWSWVASPATIISGLVNLVLVGGFLWRRSASEATAAAALQACHDRIGALRKEFDDAKAERDRYREKWQEEYQRGRDEFRRSIDATVTSLGAGNALVREQIAEMQTDNARTYATKEELRTAETRLSSTLDRLNDRLDDISEQLNKLGGEILAAVRTAQIGRG